MGQLERVAEREHVTGCGFDLAKKLNTFVFPVKTVGQEGGENDNEETIWKICHARISGLQTTLDLARGGFISQYRLDSEERGRVHLPEHYDDDKAHDTDEARKLMPLAEMGEDELELLDGATVGHGGRLVCHLVQAKNGCHLVDEDDQADGRDEATQEWAAQDVVDETEAAEPHDEDKGTGQANGHAGDLGLQDEVILLAVSGIDATLDDRADEQGAGGLGTNNHLGGAAQDGIDKGVEDEGVEAADGGDVGQVLGVGEGHGQIHGGHGDGGGEVALQPRPVVLAHPDQTRDIVGEVHEPRVLEAVLLGQDARRGHLLALHHVRDGLPPGRPGRRRL